MESKKVEKRAERRPGSHEVLSGYLIEEEVGSHHDLEDGAKNADHSPPSACLLWTMPLLDWVR